MAATTGTAGFGTLLAVNLGSGYENVAEVTDIGGPSLGQETIPMTHNESPVRASTDMPFVEKIGGLADGGQVTLEVNFLPANAGHAALAARVGRKASTPFRITWPNTGATQWTFSAFVVGFEPAAPTDDKLSASITLELTGVPTLS